MFAQLGHARVDATTVQFDLGFTRTTRTHTGSATTHLATGLAGHRLTPTAKSGKHVLHLGKLDLSFTLTALGVLAKDIQNDRGAVNDLHLHFVFQSTALGRRQLRICHNRVRTECGNKVAEFLGLSSTEIGCRIRHGSHLHHTIEYLSTRRFTQCRKFAHGVLAVFNLPLGINTNENNVF